MIIYLQCLGNHEFDHGVEGAAAFIKNLTVPVVVSNIDTSREPRLQELFNASIVLDIDGEKVGVIGVITAETSFVSSPGEYCVVSWSALCLFSGYLCVIHLLVRLSFPEKLCVYSP